MLQFKHIVQRRPEVNDLACDPQRLREVIAAPLYVNVTAMSEVMCARPVVQWYSALKQAGFLPEEIETLAVKVIHILIINTHLVFLYFS